MKILVIAAHPDDAEIGMGGSIARLAEQGHDLLIVDVTDGSPTPRGDRASRLREAAAALDALQPSPGNPRVRRVLLDLKNRELAHTLAARHAVAGAIRAHQARVLFVPRSPDAHPDHAAVTRIAEDARFDAKLTRVEMPVPPGFAAVGPPIYPTWLFSYDVSHLRGIDRPDFCLDITGFERKKLAAVRAYRSQFGPWDNTDGFAAGDPKAVGLVTADLPERLMDLGRVMGGTIGTAYAEAFWSNEPIGLTGLEGLTGLS